MKEYNTNRSVPRLKLPPAERVSPQEIERRRQVVARILERRRRIGPIGIHTDELVRDVRDEAEHG